MLWCLNQIAAEHISFHILHSFELFISQEHKEKGQKFANCYKHLLWQQKKLSTDPAMKDEVKTFKKDKERNNSKQSKNSQRHFISEM